MAASGSDAAPEAGAPGDEIEVTPEMIEAGLYHLLRFHPNRRDDEDTVVALYRAMVMAERKHLRPSSERDD
jgi:hypothetical protein